MTYQLSDPLDRTLHLQSLGTMILKIICLFLQWRKNALRIALPCIPVSISSRLSLLTPCQKPRRLSKFGPLSSPAIRKMVDRHSTCPPKPANECFSIFYPKNNCCWIFFLFLLPPCPAHWQQFQIPFFMHQFLLIFVNHQAQPFLLACVFRHSNNEMM